MASKGNPIVSARIPADLLDEVAELIERRNEWTHNEPWTLTGFIVDAIREKVAKMERSRRARRRKRPADRVEEEVSR